MSSFKSAILFVILLNTGIDSHCQKIAFSKWVTVISNVNLTSRFSVHIEGQVKINPEIRYLQGLLFRTAILYKINRHMAAGLGYVLIENHRFAGTISGFAPEQDIWQQLLLTHPVSFFIVTNRFRLEQRFISKFVVQDNAFHSDGYVFANRFRYSLKGLFPLNRQVIFQKGFYISLQNEVFLNIGDYSNLNGSIFDQNRAAASGGYRFNKSLDVDLGYMNQYIKGRNSAFTNNHILQCTANIRL